MSKLARLGAYGVLLALAIVLEMLPEFGNHGDCVFHEEEASRLSPRGYISLSKPLRHDVRFRRVTVISLTANEEPEEILTNVCSQRLFLSHLIQRLEEERASLIVIDKFFSDKSCPKNDQGTQQLQDVVRKSYQSL